MSLRTGGLDLALRSLPGVTVGMLDADLRLADAAGSWLRRTGMSAEDLIGKSLRDVAGVELAERCAPAVEAAFAGFTTRLRMRNPLLDLDPGVPRWIEVTIQPAESDGVASHVFWLLRDVTDEHDLGDALDVAEQQLDLLDEGAREYATFALDVDGAIRVWNAGAQRLLGYAPQQLIGRHLTRLWPVESAQSAVAHGVLRTADDCGSHLEEHWLLHADGHRVRCLLSLQALHDRRSDPVGYACVVRDLTDQRRAQAAIALREQMYRAAFDDAASGMALIERLAGAGWRIVEANAALADLVGHPVSALVSGAVTLLADHGGGVVREVFEAPDGAADARYEVALVRADGTRRHVVVSRSPLTVAGQDDGGERCVVQVRDVTARREAEQATVDALANERRSGEELAELQRQRADFLATVSHELRTPLSSVLGYVELFEDGHLGALTARQSAALAGIARNATRLRDLVGDLLVMSSIDQGGLRASRVPTRLDETLGRVVERIGPHAVEHGVLFQAPDAVGVLVEIDPVLLEQILLALLSNAVKFTPAGGRVTLEVGRHEGGVTVAVADDGVGIAAGDLPYVFDAFFRAAVSERLALSGTGLGLSLVRKVVEIHDGEVSVESDPGRGTRFTVRLPGTVAVANGAG